MPPPVTPLKNPHAHTNGESLTNGTSGDAEGDVHMEDMTPAGQKLRAQRSALEKMAPGSQVEEYRNSGSTTTSGQNHSNRMSGAGAHPSTHAHTAPAPIEAATPHQSHFSGSAHTPFGFPPGYNTIAAVGAAAPSHQGMGVAPALGPAAGVVSNGSGNVNVNSQGEPLDNSNGTESRHFPRWESAMVLDGGSQIPDTQPASQATNSVRTGSGGSTSTQPNPTATAKAPAALANLLNKSDEGPHPPLQMREDEIRHLHDVLADRTSGFSVEQLVQTMAELVGSVIDTRAEWDKRVVVEGVRRAFEGVREDIEACQVVMEGSYEV